MWEKINTHFHDWGHPLRPNEIDIANYKSVLPEGNRLVLGSTEELRPFASCYADLDANGIDWFKMPYPKGSFDVILGDGVFTVAGPQLFDAVMPFLKDGGVFISRVFLRNTSEKLSDHIDIRKFQGLSSNFVAVQDLFNMYGSYPTTRDYDGSDDIYYLPDLGQLPTPAKIIIPSYEYGEFYPILVWTV